MIRTIEWKEETVVVLDQRALPHEEVYLTCADYQAIADAIRLLAVRGAPAIGVAAAMGMALGAMGISVQHMPQFLGRFHKIGDILIATRPTAVNLQWAVDRMRAVARHEQHLPLAALVQRLKAESCTILEEDLRCSTRIGACGVPLLAPEDVVLTHCNAGALATAGGGTALAILYQAKAQGLPFQVYACETRPVLQGARLTAWELQRAGIPVTVITDNMAGWLMQQGRITKVLVGADRIAANGDVANKIGTYPLAVLAHHHRLPFYVAAPCSTIDITTPTGGGIPIEERDPHEVTHIDGTLITPPQVAVCNPAFDVTPAAYVTAIITDQGIIEPPLARGIHAVMEAVR
ncbi:MAG: S-methyl-5-thioribose-1-phosphate isomerase [Deltaproteobacteria bacterium]|nr:S-methyl-5-thioribose-1-phosphate isomerase [Deltaproteobacteria bacterium]